MFGPQRQKPDRINPGTNALLSRHLSHRIAHFLTSSFSQFPAVVRPEARLSPASKNQLALVFMQ